MTLSRMKKVAVVFVFLCAVCLTLLTPIRDSDFFWHLATGKWIAEHRELPVTDPFAFTTEPKTAADFLRCKIILTQYWLANLVQYGAFSLFGYYGIIGLRALVLIATLLILMAHMRKKGLGVVPSLVLLIPVFYVFLVFAGDRPNQMTFLFAACFMFLLTALNRAEKKGYLLPAVFVIWANAHGGFLLGAMIIVIAVVSELLKKIFLHGHHARRKYLAVLLLTLAAGLFNPNGYHAIYAAFSGISTFYNASIVEAMSPLAHARHGSYGYLWMLAVVLAVSVTYLFSRIFSASSGVRETVLNVSDELLCLAMLALLALSSIRYIPLLVLVAAPVIVPLFSGKFQGALNYLSGYLVPEALIAAASLLLIYSTYAVTVLNLPAVDPEFPDDAVQFMSAHEMQGHIFNYYDWGGYFIWRFYPERSVFTDGRGLILRVYDEFDSIISGRQNSGTGGRSYDAILDAYAVRHIVIPAVNTFGGIIKLLKPLEKDPRWHLVFAGRNSLVFTQDHPGQEYPKSLSYVLALSGAMEAIGRNPDSPVPYMTCAKANSYLGRRQAAEDCLERALRDRPGFRAGAVERALGLLRAGGEIPVDYE